MEDEHQHTGNDGIAIAAGGVEYLHFVEVEWFGSYFVIAVGETFGLGYLYAGIDVAGHGLCRLIDSLIGEHEAHVAIDTHVCLFAFVEAGGKIGREVKYAMHSLFAHE